MADVSFPNLQTLTWRDITSLKANFIVFKPVFENEYKRLSLEDFHEMILSEGINEENERT